MSGRSVGETASFGAQFALRMLHVVLEPVPAGYKDILHTFTQVVNGFLSKLRKLSKNSLGSDAGRIIDGYSF